jgi:CheY-like chemotaxis protein
MTSSQDGAGAAIASSEQQGMARTSFGNGDTRADGAMILLAEDHADSREALGALLEAFGFQVLLAVDGVEAIDLARRNQPDLILMDVMMPTLDGLEATRRLRGFPETRHIPIITLTALDQARDKAMAAGATDFLAKPINSAILFKKVKTWLPD